MQAVPIFVESSGPKRTFMTGPVITGSDSLVHDIGRTYEAHLCLCVSVLLLALIFCGSSGRANTGAAARIEIVFQ